MKKINYYLGALALASLSLGACSSDKLAGEEPNGPDNDVERTVYVNVAIHGEGAGSRANHPTNPDGTPGNPDGNPDEGTAGDFDNGTADEQKVNTCYLVFYDANGNVVGNVVNVTPLDFQATTEENGTISNQMKKTVTLTLLQGQDTPSKVMCYINPANPADLQNPMSFVQTVTRNAVTVASSDKTVEFFPMSSSVYYPGPDTPDNAQPIIGSDVSGKFYDTLADAEADLLKPTPEKVVDIYVERYAAKLTMTAIPTGAIKDYETYTTPDAAPGTAINTTTGKVILTFHVDGWDVNGVAKNTYAVKSFRQASTEGQILPDNYNYGMLNARINAKTITYDAASGSITPGELITGPWSWNNATYHRSYWACSPVYFQSEYPEVLSDYNATTSNQDFKSWNEIKNGGKEYGKAYYFMETTSGIPALRSKNPNAAVPTICVVGHYTMTVGGTAVNPTVFYTYTANSVDQHPTVYFGVTTGDNKTIAESELEGTVTGTVSMHKRFLWQTTTLYKNTAAEGATTPVWERLSAADKDGDLPDMVKYTTVTRPTDDVLGTLKLASYSQTLQLTDNAITANTGIYINDNGTPKAIVADNAANYDEEKQIKLSAANRILMQNVGYCHVYVDGAGKFSVPVKHLGWYRNGNEQKDATKIDMSKVRVGDLGLVRNHSYTVSITNISGLATGVAGKDNDIIPPADTKDVYAAYRINVLRWAVVPIQEVSLE